MNKLLLPRLKQLFNSTIGNIWFYIRDIKAQEALLKADLNTKFKKGTLSYLPENEYQFNLKGFLYTTLVKQVISDENQKTLKLQVYGEEYTLDVDFSLYLSTMDFITLLTVEFKHLKESLSKPMEPNSKRIAEDNGKESLSKPVKNNNSKKENALAEESSQSVMTTPLQESPDFSKQGKSSSRPKLPEFAEIYIDYIKDLIAKIKKEIDQRLLSPKESILIPAPMEEIFHFISDYKQVVKLTKGEQEECLYDEHSDIRQPGVRFRINFVSKDITAFLEVTQCYCNRRDRTAEFEFRVYDSQPYIPKIVIHYVLKEINSCVTYVELCELMIDALPYDYFRSVSLDMRKLLICLSNHFKDKAKNKGRR